MHVQLVEPVQSEMVWAACRLCQWGCNTISAALATREGGAGEGAEAAAKVAAVAKVALAIPTWQPSPLDLTVFPSDEVSIE